MRALILNSGQTLLSLLNDILDLSKVESGKIELEQVAFEPRQIISETVLLFGDLAKRKNLTVETQWEGATSLPRRCQSHSADVVQSGQQCHQIHR